MTSKATITSSASLSIGSLVSAMLILFVVFDWAESQADPDAIQAPAWFLVLLLMVIAIVSGAVCVVLKTRRQT